MFNDSGYRKSSSGISISHISSKSIAGVIGSYCAEITVRLLGNEIISATSWSMGGKWLAICFDNFTILHR